MEKLFYKRFNELYEEIGKDYRLSGKPFNQDIFGDLFGATIGQIARWRKGTAEPDTVMLAKIAEVCNVSVDWLVGFSDIRTPTAVLAAHRSNNDTLDLPEEALQSIEAFKKEIQKIYKK